jgi:hypothetical protein
MRRVADRRNKMIKLRFLGAAMILTLATPAFAQEVIQEPGEFAFYHPYGDLRIGSSPAANAMTSQPIRATRPIAGVSMPAKLHPPAGRASHGKNY